jgi:ABC-type transport system involved in multi-copper enzyme maturation permease subunit
MERSLVPTHAKTSPRAAEGFSCRRLGLVAGLDLKESLGRPLFLIFALIMLVNGWWMSRGAWIFHSIDTSLGGSKAWADSEFQTSYVYALISFFMISFFVAVATGMSLIRDGEQRVGELLHSTPLRPSEYIWGKFLAALLASFAAVLVLPVSTGLLTHLAPDPGSPDIYGPFHLMAYVRPTLVFLVPAVVFTAGVSLALGRWTGRAILVFLFPVIIFLLCNSFLWGTYPPRISEGLSDVLRYADPSGFRWLKESWLLTDRGISFYNTRPVAFDTPFLLSRVGFVLFGLLLVDLSRRHFTGRLRRPARVRRLESPAVPAAVTRTLSILGMSSRPAGFLRDAWTVTRFELQELIAQPGLYIFIPFILLFHYILYRDSRGAEFDALMLLTPGTAAVQGMPFLNLALGLLFLFYTVESLERERTSGIAPLFYATPVPTGAIVTGKIMANGAVLAVALAGAFGVVALMMAGQGRVPLEIGPFLIVWGLLLTPTMIVWMAFIAAVLALTKSRFATYGVGLGAALLTAFFFMRGHMTWVGNWPLIGTAAGGSAVAWTDLGRFEIDRPAIVLNRLFFLALAALFGWIAGRFLLRRDRDRLHPVLRPADRRRTLLTAGALALPPLVLGFTLWAEVNRGFQGATVRKQQKDYWQKNLNTWTGQPLPYVTRVEMDLDLNPDTRGFRASGFYDLKNQKDKPLYWFAVTGGTAWRGLSWTLNGRPYRPEDRSHLYVFRFAKPLAPGGSVQLGFRYRGTILPGVSRNGGDLALGEFLLPSGAVLTGRNPDFVPKIGFDPKIGVEETKNRSEPRIYPPHFYDGITDADLDRSAFTQRIRISSPADYLVNSTGVLTAETVQGGRRTRVWESDYPLRVFNLAAGSHWAVRRGPGTAVYYYPGHPYDVDSLAEALNGARRYYGQWYMPYPWRELRLNEFPAYAEYARGNATNIFFSEGVGFLAQRQPGNDVAFAIAAHESAHQWWGHIMAPGEGPGGIVLAEGAANFATLMLLEQMRGPLERQVFATTIEAQYGESRLPSDEKPLAETLELGGRPGDVVVIYNKGGWALWMLYQRMGKDAFLAGVQQFFRIYHGNPDHPVIEDFVAVLRPYAPDQAAFDDLVQQMFFQTVTPEYQLEEAGKRPLGGGAWEVTAKVSNAGTGRFPVEVAAARGDRFDGKGKISPDYKDARTTVVLGAGESRTVRIRCPFEPQRLVVDPDVNVLQLQRRAASARL